MRRLFDYFLTQLGELGLPELRQQLASYLRTQGQLDTQASNQTMAWFDSYTALEQESVALGAHGDLRKDAQQRQALRRRRLGKTVADAWYREEERRLQYALAQHEIQIEPALTPEQRKQRLAELDSHFQLPLDETQAASEMVELAMQQDELFASQSISHAERYSEREKEFGTEAAQRLAELDTRRAQWDRRVAEYRSQRQQILANRQLGDTQRSQQLEKLAATFTPNELRRVQALTGN